MKYPQWLSDHIGGLVGILLGVVIVVAFLEVVWRRETGKKWWWIKRK